MSILSTATRERLAAHLSRRLCPAAQARAREFRRALYASLSLAELRLEYGAVMGARNAADGAQHVFLAELANDLAAQVDQRLAGSRREGAAR